MKLKNYIVNFLKQFPGNTIKDIKTEIWFGTFTDENGKNCQGRYVIKRTSRIISIQLAPYGLPAVDFTIVTQNPKTGSIKLEWPDNPNKTCMLTRYNPDYYAGNWIEETKIQPLIIKRHCKQDAELQGKYLESTEIEIKIIDHAMSLLTSEDKWNRNDDRVCTECDRVSLFCALYKASIAIDREYRHMRPAIETVRDMICQGYPHDYKHILRDFNNRSDISFSDIQSVLQAAKDHLKKMLDGTLPRETVAQQLGNRTRIRRAMRQAIIDDISVAGTST